MSQTENALFNESLSRGGWKAVCIGNGQIHDAMSPSVEVSKTLNCMADPMKVLVNESEVGGCQCMAYRKTSHPKREEDGQGWEEADVNDTLNAFDNSEFRTPTLVLENHPQDSRIKIKEDGVFQTMGARQGGEGDPHTLLVLENHATDSRIKIKEDGIFETLTSRMGTGGNNVPLVMETMSVDTSHADDVVRVDDVVPTLQSRCFRGGTNVLDNYVIRRLTPLECERLQGFPDGWTDIGEWTDTKGKKHKGDSDAPRYKALGNSIAIPFWEWMADRMVKQLNKEDPTMASLFDGIGGFPLSYQRAGCKPVWASEIEEFPIAVTKKRFGDT